MNDILKHRLAVNANIQRLFGEGIDCNSEFQKAQDSEIEKARHGTYADTAENRKLNRVGQEYGHKAQEKEPSGKQPKQGEEAGGKDYSSYAQNASDDALKRAANDAKADKGVRDAAKKELEKRGGGSGSGDGGNDGGDKMVENIKNELLNKENLIYEDPFEYDHLLEKLHGKTFEDPKYGECDAKEYVRLMVEFRKEPDSRIKSLKSGQPKDTPHGAAYHKASDEILKLRKSGDEKFQPKEKKEKEQPKRLGKNAYVKSKDLENSLSLEFGSPNSKESRAAMSAVRYAVKNFLDKNPTLNVTKEEWDEIAEGFEDGDAYKKYSKLKGFDELNDRIEEYVDVAASED